MWIVFYTFLLHVSIHGYVASARVSHAGNPDVTPSHSGVRMGV